jgi:hypothetical protein
MMSDEVAKPWAKRKRRPSWLIPLYDRLAWEVSPVIVDIEAAYRASRIDVVSALLNQANPQLHVSLIDTPLSAFDLAEHLRLFTYLITDDRRELTLRLADCIVLTWLQKVMSAAQWAAIHRNILRWRVHSPDGQLFVLPSPDETEIVEPPLHLSDHQLADLEQLHEPYQLMSDLRAMRYGHQWAETPMKEIELAEVILRAWKQYGHTDSATRLIFARGVFDTHGRLLRMPSLGQILRQTDSVIAQRDIEEAVAWQKRNYG